MGTKVHVGKQGNIDHGSVFLDELEEGTAGPLLVMVSRKWDVSINGRYMSTDFIISDKKGNLMHCMSRHNKSYKFVDRIQEGRLYTLTGCKVLPNRKDFQILKDCPFMIELDGFTSVKNAIGDVGGFVRYPFPLVSFEALVPTENKYFVDLVGYVTCVGDPIKKSNGSETVEFNLTNESGRQVRVTLWGSLGEEMIKKKAANPGGYFLILTALSAKNFMGELGVSSSSATQLTDSEDVPVLKSFKNALSGRDLNDVRVNVVDNIPQVSTIEELLQWGRAKKDGYVKEGNVVFRNTVEIVDIRTRNGWYLTTCPTGRCRKGLTRVKGSFWCEGCNTSVLYPRLRYKIQMNVRDECAETVVVLFDEAAEKLLSRTAKSLMDEEEKNDIGDDVLPPVLRDLIGSQHIFEIKGHTYYRYGEYEIFNCSQVILPGSEDDGLRVGTSEGSAKKTVVPVGTSEGSVKKTGVPASSISLGRTGTVKSHVVDGEPDGKGTLKESEVCGLETGKSWVKGKKAAVSLSPKNPSKDVNVDTPDKKTEARKRKMTVVDYDDEVVACAEFNEKVAKSEKQGKERDNSRDIAEVVEGDNGCALKNLEATPMEETIVSTNDTKQRSVEKPGLDEE